MKKLLSLFFCTLLAALPLTGCGAEPVSPVAEKELFFCLPGVTWGMTIEEACAALGWKPEEAEVAVVPNGKGEPTDDKSYQFTGKTLWDIPMEWVYLRCEEGAAPIDRGVVEVGMSFSFDRTGEVAAKVGETIGARVVEREGKTPEIIPPRQADVFTVGEWDRLRQELISVRKVFGELPEEVLKRQTEEEAWDGMMENEKKNAIVGVLLSQKEDEDGTGILSMRGLNAAMLNRMRMEKE